MGKVRKILLTVLVIGACLGAASTAMAEGLVLSKGCYCGRDDSNTLIQTGFRSWYASNYTGTGKYGLVNPYGVFRYISVVASANNTGNVIVWRYKRYGNPAGDSAYLVATDYFGPGGGFADYIECDSIQIAKGVAADTISYKMCW